MTTKILAFLLCAIPSLTFAGQNRTQSKRLSHINASTHRAPAETTDRPSLSPFGLGIVLGSPSGISGKYWLSEKHAVDAAIAFSWDNFFILYSDYLFHFPNAFLHHATTSRSATESEFLTHLTPYVGVGGVLFFSSNQTSTHSGTLGNPNANFGLGVRVPLGLEWTASSIPLGVYFELAPGLGLAPRTFAFLQGGLGARWYF